MQRLMSKRRWHCRKGEARGSLGVDVMSYHWAIGLNMMSSVFLIPTG